LHDRKERIAAQAKPKPKIKAQGKAKGKDRQKKKEEPRYREDATRLVGQNYGVSVSADSAEAMACMDVHALVVDSRGDIVSTVSKENFSAMKAALVHSPCSELNGETKGHGGGHGRFRPGSCVWFTLSRLPPNVRQIIFLLVTADGVAARREPLKGCMMRIIDSSGEVTSSYLVEPDPSGVSVLAILERPASEGTWTFARVDLPPSKGNFEHVGKRHAHFADALEPIGSIVRELIVGALKPQRISLVLERGMLADLLQSFAPKGVFFGAGWDYSCRYVEDYRPHDRLSVDVAAVFFSSVGKELGAVSAENPAQFGVRHSGSGMVSAGVAFNFDSISKEVSQFFLIAHVTTPNMTCDNLQNPSCRLIDHNGVVVLSFTVTDLKRQPGLILGRFSLEPGRRKWCFQAVGRFCGGRSWDNEETMSQVREICQTSLIDFQRQLDNVKPMERTDSDRLVKSI
jgi:stress response protein SCP2